MPASVVIFGANAAGLAAALRLRNQQCDVTIVESSSRIRDNIIRQDGFVFDTRDTFFTLPAVYRDLFLKTGKPLEDCVELIPLDQSCRFEFSDGTSFVMPGASPARMSHAIAEALNQEAGQEWAEFLEKAADEWDVQRQSWNLSTELWNTKFRESRLNELVDSFALLQGRDPHVTSQAFISHIYMLLQFGSWHIRGGIGQLTQVLFERAQERGVHFEFDAQSFDTNADVYVDALTQAPPQVALKRFLVAVESAAKDLCHHNVWISDDVVIYMCRPEDDSMHPLGQESWNVQVIARPGHADAINSLEIETVLQRIDKESTLRMLWSHTFAAEPEVELQRASKDLVRVGGDYTIGIGLPFDGISAELLAEKMRKKI